MQKVCVGYVRVSTKQQAQTGHSLGTQKKEIKKWTESNGYKLENIYEDAGISASSINKRPALKMLLRDLKKDYYVVVASTDRLSRDLKDALEIYNVIKEKGARLMVLDIKLDIDDPEWLLSFKILSVSAQIHLELIKKNNNNSLRMRGKKSKENEDFCPIKFMKMLILEEGEDRELSEKDSEKMNHLNSFVLNRKWTKISNKPEEKKKENQWEIINFNEYLQNEFGSDEEPISVIENGIIL